MNGEHSLIPGCAFCFTKLFAGTFYETKGICAGCAAYGDEVCRRRCTLQNKSGENTVCHFLLIFPHRSRQREPATEVVCLLHRQNNQWLAFV